MSVQAKIAVLPGDGIGPEVTEPSVKILRLIAEAKGHKFEFEEHDFGGISIDNHGVPVTDATLDACRDADAVILGAIGGPKWASNDVRPEQGLLKLRKDLGVFANIRPCSLISESYSEEASPLKWSRLKGTDFIVVRELTGGIYFGDRSEGDPSVPDGKAFDTMVYTVPEIERIARVAGKLAMGRRKKITSVDKHNVLACSRLWRKVVTRVIQEEFPEVKLEHQYVDAAAMLMLKFPSEYDIVVTGNMFGDILTDEASMLPGSLGLLPSASVTESGWGVYEPIHGSAPDIAGQGLANPIGSILSAAMLLRESLGLRAEADMIEKAVAKTLENGHRTKDIQGSQDSFCSTTELGDAVIESLQKMLSA